MILVDTSVWIDHARKPNTILTGLLVSASVCLHPAVVGELAMGNLGVDRQTVLNDLLLLPGIREAGHTETRLLIDIHALHGRGIGYIDAQLLASTIAAGHRMWTNDRRLKEAANQLGVAYTP